MKEEEFDVCIVGAGPSGLSCALSTDPSLRVCIIDAGVSLQDRIRDGVDGTVCGFGGASLCNDGKLSFGRAGSSLRYLPKDALERGKRALGELFHIEEDEEHTPSSFAGGDGTATFSRKVYPVVKTTREQRLGVMQSIFDRLDARRVTFRFATVMQGLDVSEQHRHPHFYTLMTNNGSLRARAVVLAAGRLGPLTPGFFSKIPSTFRRFELGVRVFVSQFPLLPTLNPTDVWTTCVDGVEVQYRSFCWCNGPAARVVLPNVRCLGIKGDGFLMSGTTDPLEGDDAADDSLMGCNVGFMARITTDSSTELFLRNGAREWVEQQTRFSMTEDEFLAYDSSSNPWFGLLQKGLHEFKNKVLGNSCTIVAIKGPCCEGVGNYPNADPQTQRVDGHGGALFAVGDGAGHLRGLVPSFLSGWCCGETLFSRLSICKAFEEVQQKGLAFGSGPAWPSSHPNLEDLDCIDNLFAPAKSNPFLLFEVHTFLAPLNPDPATRERYYAVIDVFNKHMPHAYGRFWKPMKGPFLGLKFGNDYVNVMQSARYVYGFPFRSVVEKAFHEDAHLFRAAGFDVLRVKVELSMHGTVVRPEYLSKWPKLYSEHHLRVFHESLNQLADPTAEELLQLDELAKSLETSLGLTVALSFNRKPHESVDLVPGKKRFLNVRFRGFDSPEPALRWVNLFYERLRDSVWKKGAAIDEWVVFDSYSDMDRGWIDPSHNRIVVCAPQWRDKLRDHARKIGVAVKEFDDDNDDDGGGGGGGGGGGLDNATDGFVGILLYTGQRELSIKNALICNDGDIQSLFGRFS